MTYKYRVLNRKWSKWNIRDLSDCMVDMDDIERLADEWCVPVSELMEDVEERPAYEYLNHDELMDWYDCSDEVAEVLHRIQRAYGCLDNESGCSCRYDEGCKDWLSVSDIVDAILDR